MTPERIAEIRATYERTVEKFGEHAFLSPTLRTMMDLITGVERLRAELLDAQQEIENLLEERMDLLERARGAKP